MTDWKDIPADIVDVIYDEKYQRPHFHLFTNHDGEEELKRNLRARPEFSIEEWAPAGIVAVHKAGVRISELVNKAFSGGEQLAQTRWQEKNIFQRIISAVTAKL